MSIIAHPRINDGIEEIDDEVEDDGEDCDDHDRAHHQCVVAVEGGIDEIPPYSGNLKNRLCSWVRTCRTEVVFLMKL